MPIETITPPGSPPPLAPYSSAVRAGDTIYVSGMLAIASDGSIAGAGDVRAQTRHVLDAIGTVLQAAGASLADVAYNQIFLKDLADYAAFNEVYATYFPDQRPARYCIRADLVKPEFLVEIASTAYVGGAQRA
ncbi:Rid family hydrolase [Bordetella genomosp. 13]|uniref:Rid family hydrolase n=1 Tax=Bordetella genomosp. 13 TaxID=463040 RepID=UPI00119FDAF4|nr:Rid family hydrolase [Bordetella genomosp. 13]